jgi:hypothetical protein
MEMSTMNGESLLKKNRGMENREKCALNFSAQNLEIALKYKFTPSYGCWLKYAVTLHKVLTQGHNLSNATRIKILGLHL